MDLPATKKEICRRASKDQHAVHLREFTETYVHHRAGVTARDIQSDLIGTAQAAGVHDARMVGGERDTGIVPPAAFNSFSQEPRLARPDDRLASRLPQSVHPDLRPGPAGGCVLVGYHARPARLLS